MDQLKKKERMMLISVNKIDGALLTAFCARLS
jgi:hypothetical protein